MFTSIEAEHPFWYPKTRANPHPLYAQMRENEPVCIVQSPFNEELSIVLLTRYDDCVNLLKDNDPRIVKTTSKLSSATRQRLGLGEDDNSLIYKSILYLDPPDHTRLRSLVHKAFTPRRIQNLLQKIQEITTELLDEMEAHQEVNFISSFAHPLPIIVISEMLGLPKSDRHDFRNWAMDILFSTGDGAQEKTQTAAIAFVQYFSKLIEQRRNNPQDDILCGLILASDEDDKLSHEEILGMILLLLVAGFETTTNLLGNGLLALLQNPDQLQLFRDNKDNPDFVNTAIEELLRYDSPVDATSARFATEDMDYLGTPLRAGNKIHALLVAANRDPAHFDNPNVLDLQRKPNKHISFGNGIHYCLGAPLARMEASTALPALLSRFSDIQVTQPIEELEWSHSLITRGMVSMPIHVAH